MRGFLSLEPDAATVRRLFSTQNRLRDAIARQGVAFPERLEIVLLAWPFAREDQLSEAAERLQGIVPPPILLHVLAGRPNADRPAEVGFAADGLVALQERLFAELRTILDPDPPKAGFVRLARVSPPSRKVGAALRGSGVLGCPGDAFRPERFALWRQTPHCFEVCRTMPIEHGRP